MTTGSAWWEAFHLISDQVDRQELAVILKELEVILRQNTLGDVVEFGCYSGTTSLFLQRAILRYQSPRQLYVYDSFEGLPAKTNQDNSPIGAQFQSGELTSSKSKLAENFKKASLPLPQITKGWFSQLSSEQLPDAIAFAFLDSDFFPSIIDSLRLVWPKLSTGSRVIVDDYSNLALPGAKKAVDEWLGNHPAKLRIEASLAIISK